MHGARVYSKHTCQIQRADRILAGGLRAALGHHKLTNVRWPLVACTSASIMLIYHPKTIIVLHDYQKFNGNIMASQPYVDWP